MRDMRDILSVEPEPRETFIDFPDAPQTYSLGSGPMGKQKKPRKGIKAKRRQNKTRLIKAKRKK